MSWMYLPKWTWKPAKTVIIRLYRTAFRVDHEIAHSYFIPTILTWRVRVLTSMWLSPTNCRDQRSSAEGLSLAGKTRGSLGRRKGKKGLFRSSIVADIFPNWPPFFFSFSPSAEPGLRLGLATLRYINATQTNSLNPTKITVLMCEQKPYFCGRKGIQYHSMNRA